jgi:hypothetical protein
VPEAPASPPGSSAAPSAPSSASASSPSSPSSPSSSSSSSGSGSISTGLDLDGGRRQGGDDRLVRVVEERDALDRRHVRQAERVADLEPAHVGLDVLGHLHRERLDADLVRDLAEHAARLRPGRLPDQRHGDRGMDRTVEPDLVEVDVRDLPSHGILLVVLEDGGMDRLLALEHDVEHRMEARRAGQRPAQHALVDRDRPRVALAVEHAGHPAGLAQTARLGRAELLALPDLQLDPVSGHGGGL